MATLHTSMRGRAAPLILVALVVGSATGCSEGDGTTFHSASTDAATASRVAFSPLERWGDGRALAIALGTGTTAIVTTTGVFAQRTGEPLRRVIELTGELDRVLAELDASERYLALATSTELRIVDLESGDEQSVLLPVGATPSQLLAGTDGWIVNTSDGVLIVPTEGGETTPLDGDVVASGEIAVGGDRTIVPVAASTTVTISDGAGDETVQLGLAEDATLLDAKLSRGGQLAVSSGAGPDEFDRTDQINIVGDDGVVAASIDFDRILDPSTWVVADEAVVVATDQQLSAWRFDGTPIVTVDQPTAQPVESVHHIDGAIVIVHNDGSIGRWNTSDWTLESIAPGGTTTVGVDVSPDGSRFATVDFFGRIAERPSEPDAAGIELLEFAVGEATSASIADDGRVAVGTSMGDAYLLDATLTELQRVRPSDSARRIGSVEFDDSAETLVTGISQRVGDISFDDTVVGWDVADGSELYRLGGDEQDVAGCAFFYSRVRMSPDGALMALSSHDFSVVVVDPFTGDELDVLEGPTSLLDVAFVDDGDHLVITYDDATVAVYSTEDFSEVASYETAMGGYQAVAPVAGGLMAVADVTGAVELVDADTGVVERQLGTVGLRTTVLETSPDGALVASPTTASEVVVWSAASGQEVARLAGHTGEVIGLDFSDDGATLASASRDGTVRTWSVDELPTG